MFYSLPCLNFTACNKHKKDMKTLNQISLSDLKGNVQYLLHVNQKAFIGNAEEVMDFIIDFYNIIPSAEYATEQDMIDDIENTDTYASIGTIEVFELY